MILATQYLRPPFPHRERWRSDLAEIKATGLDAIVIASPWAWIEPSPGELQFDDYDELIGIAAELGLQVILNPWLELQPVWVHEEYPDAHMVDHRGHRVISSQLAYAQFGLTPGACTDHPQVREHAARTLTAMATRYAHLENLLMWDCWNEIRWLTQADGYVCHCEHTVDRFRGWLRDRYGDLDGLNAAWNRRYRSWSHVVPAKLPTRTYTDMMAFLAFLTDRAAEDLRWRRDAVHAGDPSRPIVAHTVFPSVSSTGEFFEFEPPLVRGNDWALADQVDGLGSSHFPAWLGVTGVDFAVRLEASRCAAGDKIYWMSEVQGGAAGHGMQAMEPVPAQTQQRWIWTGIARGAKGASFWCWRDEVFGRESGGFGIVGNDGHREERLAALRATADVLAENQQLLDSYTADRARVGVVLEPRTYHLDWAATLGAGPAGSGVTQFQAGHSVQGYLRALECLQVPYDLLDPAHALNLDDYEVLILPWPLVVDPELGERLLAWAQAGGTLVTESELDAFDANGLYRYPDERPLAKALGIAPQGRRTLSSGSLDFELAGVRGRLPGATWLEPLETTGGDVIAGDERGATILRVASGAGNVIAIGTCASLAYWQDRDRDFERFLAAVIREAGVTPAWVCDDGDGERIQWRTGFAGETRLLFAINLGAATSVVLSTSPLDVPATVTHVEDLRTGESFELERSDGRVSLSLSLDAEAVRVLRFGGER